jgi:hypothetical protein
MMDDADHHSSGNAANIAAVASRARRRFVRPPDERRPAGRMCRARPRVAARLYGALLVLAACAGRPPAAADSSPASGAPAAVPGELAAVDAARLMAIVRDLAHDSLEGRRTGSAGAARARLYIARELARIGLPPMGRSFEHPFSYPDGSGGAGEGVNLVGWVRGGTLPDRYIVVTAHYDHVGTREGVIYNGADDNASGVAALLALADWFQAHPPRHSIIFAALDAEEVGLRGARAFVDAPPIPKEAIALNVNLDMVGRSAAGELFAAGTHHHPALRPLLDSVAARAPITLRFGHDRPNLPAGDDWTMSSDHGRFHAAGIPFVYFGVEDHADYHKPTDDPERIDPTFFAGAVRTVLDAVRVLDRNLDAIAPAPR